MSKIAVVYWTGTGNTEAMANKVAEGAREAGADVTMFTADSFSASKAGDYDAFAFGCPAMGDEMLEETEFQPMWDDVQGSLGAKIVGLFGSWGWGNGVWMDSWKEDAAANGVNVISTVICSDAPDEAAETECRDLGKTLV